METAICRQQAHPLATAGRFPITTVYLRTAAVLSNRFEIPAQRLSISGYADTVPVADNDTPEGRARNRRVDLVILNNYAIAKTEPAKIDPAKTEPAKKE